MRLKDFKFSYKLLLYNFFSIKKDYFKGLRKLINFPIKYKIYLLKNFFKIGTLNLDQVNVKNYDFDYLFNKFNSDKAKKVKFKGTISKGHNYSPHYEKHLKK